jgi:hypothetical protein
MTVASLLCGNVCGSNSVDGEGVVGRHPPSWYRILLMRDETRQRRPALGLLIAVCLLVFVGVPCVAGERAGELRLEVSDASGAALQARGKLVNQANGFALQFETSAEGGYVAKRLPFGRYELTVGRVGFAQFHSLVNIRSELPVHYAVALGIASRNESITVNSSSTILDTTNPGAAYEIGKAALQQRLSSTPGRALIDVVQEQPDGSWSPMACFIRAGRNIRLNT